MAAESAVKLSKLRALVQKHGGEISPLACLPPLSVPLAQAGGARKPGVSGQERALLDEAVAVIARAEVLKKATTLLPGGRLKTSLLYSAPGMKAAGLQVEEDESVSFCGEALWLEPALSLFHDGAPAGEKAFTRRLDFHEALVLAALLEADGGTSSALTPQSVASALVSLTGAQVSVPAVDPPALAAMLTGLLEGSTPDAAAVEEALRRLETVGLAARNGSGWQAGPQWAPFTSPGAAPLPAIYLNRSALRDGALESADMLVYPAGSGWLAFACSPAEEGRIDLTAYRCIAPEKLLDDFFSRPPGSEPAPSPVPGRESLSTRKLTGKVWAALVLGLLSLCLACGGCGLAAWALNMK